MSTHQHMHLSCVDKTSQTCIFTFTLVEELKIEVLTESEKMQEWTNPTQRGQFSWSVEFMNQSGPDFHEEQSLLIYTVSVLYILLLFISEKNCMKMSAAPLAGFI